MKCLNYVYSTCLFWFQLSGKDILSSIGSEMSGDLEDGFKAISELHVVQTGILEFIFIHVL